MSQRIAIFFLVFAMTASVTAQESATTTPTAAEEPAISNAASKEDNPVYLICKNKTAVRTLRVQKQPKGKCTTTYTKNGADQVVSRASEFSICSKVLSNIRENLEKANWKCKDISEARVSSSE